ncbi:MAG: NAD(P)/FAD-dependent oxidoreductase [Candidatus Aenigmarchaeota archaeon]|nr:NAD(P)/FAD-dependent oxidoreductase [Candidatus Aenigmarchaeota archaeon]
MGAAETGDKGHQRNKSHNNIKSSHEISHVLMGRPLYLAFGSMSLMYQAQVSIIGAGPIGSYLSKKLAQKGIDTALIDRKNAVGKYACSGLISKRITSFVRMNSAFLEHKIYGAVFHSPDNSFTLRRNTTQAYVVDRPLFDKHLFSEAVRAGAKTFLGAPAEKICVLKDAVECTAGQEKITSKMVVGCDGACSFLRNHLGFFGKTRLVNGIMSYVDECNSSPLVELYYGKRVAPGFFAWKIPRGKRTEYGLAAKENHISYFKKFLSSEGVLFEKYYAHPIVFGEQESCKERAILVGDAAAQVKPFSGGGLIYGFISADIAARAIKKAFDKDDFSKEFFQKEYEARWHKKLISKIRMGGALRGILDSLDNSELDALFGALSEEKKSMEKIGDMDFL